MILLALALTLAGSKVPPPPPPPPETPPPARVTTELMTRHAGKIVVTASSSWTGWGPERLVDGDPETSWFSGQGDAAAKGKRPWVALRFPVAIEVKSVSILGNREPSWPKGFSIHLGDLELLDADGRVLARVRNETKNKVADLDFKLKAPVAGVHVVRFTSLLDDGDKTAYEDIALAEILVE